MENAIKLCSSWSQWDLHAKSTVKVKLGKGIPSKKSIWIKYKSHPLNHLNDSHPPPFTVCNSFKPLKKIPDNVHEMLGMFITKSGKSLFTSAIKARKNGNKYDSIFSV